MDRNLFVHDAPNVAVISGSVFPSTGAKNPTETIEALAWRAGSYIGRNMDKLAA